MYKYLFGPVPSRRLGISLGIDLVPYKVCSLDCVYCEVGKTTNLTCERKEYVSTEGIINELKQYLGTNPKLDYITFSGAGEPLLHSRIGFIVKFIKENFPQYKLCLITNSTLLYREEVRNEVLDVDLILPSVDAILESSLKKINRPCSGLTAKKINSGLIEFSRMYKGKIWLEFFVIEGINDSSEELLLLQGLIDEIKPEQVQLNSLDRPGTESWVKKATYETMLKVKDSLKNSEIKIISKFDSNKKVESLIQSTDLSEVILATISRRPCTAKDISESTGHHINEVNKYLRILEKEKQIVKEIEDRGSFYRALT